MEFTEGEEILLDKFGFIIDEKGHKAIFNKQRYTKFTRENLNEFLIVKEDTNHFVLISENPKSGDSSKPRDPDPIVEKDSKRDGYTRSPNPGNNLYDILVDFFISYFLLIDIRLCRENLIRGGILIENLDG